MTRICHILTILVVCSLADVYGFPGDLFKLDNVVDVGRNVLFPGLSSNSLIRRLSGLLRDVLSGNGADDFGSRESDEEIDDDLEERGNDNRRVENNNGREKGGDGKEGKQNGGNRKEGKQNGGNGNEGHQNGGNGKVGKQNGGNGKEGHQKGGNGKEGKQNGGNGKEGKQNGGNGKEGIQNSGNGQEVKQNGENGKEGKKNGGNGQEGTQNSGNRKEGKKNGGNGKEGKQNGGNGKEGKQNGGNGKEGKQNGGNGKEGKQNGGNGQEGKRNGENGNSIGNRQTRSTMHENKGGNGEPGNGGNRNEKGHGNEIGRIDRNHGAIEKGNRENGRDGNGKTVKKKNGEGNGTGNGESNGNVNGETKRKENGVNNGNENGETDGTDNGETDGTGTGETDGTENGETEETESEESEEREFDLEGLSRSDMTELISLLTAASHDRCIGTTSGSRSAIGCVSSLKCCQYELAIASFCPGESVCCYTRDTCEISPEVPATLPPPGPSEDRCLGTISGDRSAIGCVANTGCCQYGLYVSARCDGGAVCCYSRDKCDGYVDYRGKTVSDKAVRDKLEEIADLFGTRLSVFSGDRVGTGRSHHYVGRAADFWIDGGLSGRAIFNRIKDSGILPENYQVIWHGSSTCTQGEHIHIGRYDYDRATCWVHEGTYSGNICKYNCM